jgi:hypothetical protein
MSEALPIVIGPEGPISPTPDEVRAALLTLVQAAQPGYTANLPGSLIEDISSTDTYAILQCEAARVALINSLTPYGANDFLLRQLGNIYGVPLGLGSTTSVEVTFSGTPGYVLSAGFTVSDGTYQYALRTGGIIGQSGDSGSLFALALEQGTWAVPANTVTGIVTSVPSTVTLAVTNPLAGTPGTSAQTAAEYRAQVLQAGLAVSQGMPSALRTSLELVSGVDPRLVSIRQQVDGWQILVGGGDPYEAAYAIFTGLFDISDLVGSSLEIIAATKANPCAVTTNITHGLTTGDSVEINGVVGMVELNGNTYTATVTGPQAFTLGVNSSAYTTYVSGGTISPDLRTEVVSIYDYPDTYTVTMVRPLQQIVDVTLLWNTTSTNLVSPAAVAQLGSPALVSYINSIVVGQPMNLFQMQNAFQEAVAAIVPSEQLTRMAFSISIDGVSTLPTAGTGVIAGDPESYFYADATTINISQG